MDNKVGILGNRRVDKAAKEGQMILNLEFKFKPISKQGGTKRGRYGMYLSDSYQRFKEAVGLLSAVQRNQQGWKLSDKPLIAIGTYFKPDKLKGRRHDIVDNAFSGFIDAMKGIIFKDDSQFFKVTWIRAEAKGKEPLVTIQIKDQW